MEGFFLLKLAWYIHSVVQDSVYETGVSIYVINNQVDAFVQGFTTGKQLVAVPASTRKSTQVINGLNQPIDVFFGQFFSSRYKSLHENILKVEVGLG